MNQIDRFGEGVQRIDLNTEIAILAEDWTLNFGIEGLNDIEQDVRLWARNLLTAALEANGVRGQAS